MDLATAMLARGGAITLDDFRRACVSSRPTHPCFRFRTTRSDWALTRTPFRSSTSSFVCSSPAARCSSPSRLEPERRSTSPPSGCELSSNDVDSWTLRSSRRATAQVSSRRHHRRKLGFLFAARYHRSRRLLLRICSARRRPAGSRVSVPPYSKPRPGRTRPRRPRMSLRSFAPGNPTDAARCPASRRGAIATVAEDPVPAAELLPLDAIAVLSGESLAPRLALKVDAHVEGVDPPDPTTRKPSQPWITFASTNPLSGHLALKCQGLLMGLPATKPPRGR